MRIKIILACIISLSLAQKTYAQNENKLRIVDLEPIKTTEYKTNTGHDIIVTLDSDPSSFVDKVYNENHGTLTLRYYDTTAKVVILKNDVSILSTNITKQDFLGVFDKEIIDNYIILHFDLQEQIDTWFNFMATLCIPDTDLCYYVSVKINSETKEIVYEEIIIDEKDMWDL